MSWTPIAKPVSPAWTGLTKPSATSYTNIPKPQGSVIAILGPGRATGLIAPPTYPTGLTLYASTWHNINKPI